MSNWQAAEEDDIQDEFDQLELDSAVLSIFYLIFLKFKHVLKMGYKLKN